MVMEGREFLFFTALSKREQDPIAPDQEFYIALDTIKNPTAFEQFHPPAPTDPLHILIPAFRAILRVSDHTISLAQIFI